MNNRTFSGKVALVTGGTSGIGKATAIEFARAGAKVVLTGRREKEGAQVVAEIEKLGGDAAFVRTDVAKDADVKAMIDFTVDKFGRLDVAFNNAGVEWKGPLDQATEAEYRRIFDINVWGVLNSMRHEIPVMLGRRRADSLANVSAAQGLSWPPILYHKLERIAFVANDLFVLQQLQETVIRNVFDRLHPAAVKEHRHRDQTEGDHDEDDATPIEIGFAPAVSILSLRIAIELSHKQKRNLAA
jgi:NAD(P)-dependent dehydrogenase (short-subunit alcohol dehydrogenase family)